MGKLIYSMSVSLDGFVTGPDGDFEWSVPDEELHRFHNARVGRLSAHLLGRKLYETMVYWETAEEDPALSDYAAEFARIWQQLPKVVFSSTLTEVEGNTRLAMDLTRSGGQFPAWVQAASFDAESRRLSNSSGA